MLIQNDMGWRSIRHAVEASEIHAEDERLAQLKRQRDVIVVSHRREQPVPQVAIPGFNAGWQFIVREGAVVRASEPEFCEHLDRLKEERSWYAGEMKDKRRGTVRTVRRKVKKGRIKQFGITLAPWYSLAITAMAEHDPEGARRLLDQIVGAVVRGFAAESGRDVLAASVHIRHRHNIHIHIQNTRISKDHRLIGERGHRSYSQWTAGVLRQLDQGVIGEDSEQARLARENVEHFKKRYKDKLPINWELCKIIDQLCWGVLGQSLYLTKSLSIYKRMRAELIRRDLEERKAGAERELQALGLEFDANEPR